MGRLFFNFQCCQIPALFYPLSFPFPPKTKTNTKQTCKYPSFTNTLFLMRCQVAALKLSHTSEAF